MRSNCFHGLPNISIRFLDGMESMEPGRFTTVFLSSCQQVACGSFGEEFFKTLEDWIRIAVGNRSASREVQKITENVPGM